MSNSDNTSHNGNVGIGFTWLLTIAFIVLKLCGVINWSWVWVLSPIWISFAIVIIILVCFVIANSGGVSVRAHRRK